MPPPPQRMPPIEPAPCRCALPATWWTRRKPHAAVGGMDGRDSYLPAVQARLAAGLGSGGLAREGAGRLCQRLKRTGRCKAIVCWWAVNAAALPPDCHVPSPTSERGRAAPPTAAPCCTTLGPAARAIVTKPWRPPAVGRSGRGRASRWRGSTSVPPALGLADRASRCGYVRVTHCCWLAAVALLVFSHCGLFRLQTAVTATAFIGAQK